jgi:hypothetical protein
VANQPRVKEWLLRKITQKEENHLEQDIIVQIPAHAGNQDIGPAKLGNMKIVISESQLKTLLESYDSSFGFVDERNEGRIPLVDVLVSYDEWALVKKKDSKETYIVHVDDVPHEYYQGYYHWVDEDDPYSWQGSYREFEDDTQLYEDGVAFFAEDLISDDDTVTTNVDELYNADYYCLKITPENKAEVYIEFEDLIKAYLEPSYEERKKDKKAP